MFFVIVGFYLLGWIGRWALTAWLRKKQREFASGADPFSRVYTWGTRSGARPSRPQSEGNVTVSEAEPQEKKINKNVGDYVDYEEVK